MRKCIITTNIRTTRTDEELQELWEKSLLQTAIDPSIDSIGRRDFYSINRTYWEKKKLLDYSINGVWILRNLIMEQAIIPLQ